MNKLSERSVAAFRARLVAWYARHKRAMPWRGTRDAYRVWVSEVMLQQTRVAAVLPYYRRFLRRFPTVRALAGARSEEVLKLWAGLGYYSRARNLHRAAKEIVAKHGGKFPREAEAALALPGVGRYTAAAVLSIAYGEPLAVVDGNVARVLARLSAMRGDVRAPGKWRKLEEKAQELITTEVTKSEKRSRGLGTKTENRNTIPRTGDEKREKGLTSVPTRSVGTGPRKPIRGRRELQAGEWNQAMMELGATLCTPRAPRCEECPVRRWCKAYKLGIAEQVPAARKKRAAQKIELAAAVLVDARGRTLLVRPEQAETNGLFSRMWQFPAVEVRGNARAELRRHLRDMRGAKGQNLLEPQMNTDERRYETKTGKDLTQRAQRATKNTENNGSNRKWEELAGARHSVTYREITLRPFVVRVDELPRLEGARVVRLEALSEQEGGSKDPPLHKRYIPAISSATRKIARAAVFARGKKTRKEGIPI